MRVKVQAVPLERDVYYYDANTGEAYDGVANGLVFRLVSSITAGR